VDLTVLIEGKSKYYNKFIFYMSSQYLFSGFIRQKNLYLIALNAFLVIIFLFAVN